MKVLVIEDHPGMARTIEAILVAAGHEAVLAPNGRIGTDMLANGGFSMVITDIMMPEQDGLETIRKLKVQRPELKVIAISGSDSFGGINYLPVAQQFGAVATLRKPFQPLDLIRLLDEHAPEESAPT